MYSNLMQQAILALRERRNEDAQAILINVIVSEPEDDEAWLLLADAIADAGKKRECLERARAINPRNYAILRALERLGGSPHSEAAVTEEPPVEAGPTVPETVETASPSRELADAVETASPVLQPADAVETAGPVPQPADATESVGPLLEQGELIAQTVLMTTEAPDTRRAGWDLVLVLREAASRDAVTTRRWARSAGRGALIKYEKALTSFIANLPRDDPQLPLLREQRQLVLEQLK